MTFFRLSLRAAAITMATAALACGVIAVIALAGPRPIESAVLGTEWQCIQTAFVVTTCSPRMQQATPAMETSRNATRG